MESFEPAVWADFRPRWSIEPDVTKQGDTGGRHAGFRGAVRCAKAREITYAFPTMRDGICEVQRRQDPLSR